MHPRSRKPRRARLVYPLDDTALKTGTNASIAPKTPGRPKKTGKTSTQPSRTSSRLRRRQVSDSPAPAVVVAPVDENEDGDEDEDENVDVDT